MTTTWPMLVGPVLAAAALLVVPGLAVAHAVRLRGLLAWGVAPVLSAGLLAVTALVLGVAGVGWGWLPVLAATLLAAGAAAGGTALLRARALPAARPPAPLRRALLVATVAAGAAAVALQTVRLVRAIGEPDAIAQSYDTVFHLNAVAFILDGGNASALAMTMGTPGRTATFYPTLWHGLVALVEQASGAGVPAATNAVALAVVLVAWPLSVVGLARAVLGPRPLPVAAAAALAYAFVAFPNRLMSFGILYPNLLGYAVLPGAVALAAVLLGGARARERLVVSCLLVLAGAGLTCAHPNAVIALLVIVAPLVLLTAVRTTRRLAGQRYGHLRAGALWVGLMALVAGGYVLSGTVPGLAWMRGRAVWAVHTSVPEAVRDVIDLSLPSPVLVGQPFEAGAAQPLLAALVVVGVVVALRSAHWRWLPLSYAAVAALFVVSAGWEHPLRGELTGYWYADSIRLAALLPVVGVPLAALGVLGLVRLLARAGRMARLHRPAPVVALALVLGVLVVSAWVAGRLPATRASFEHVRWMHTVWPDDQNGNLLDAAELEFLDEVAELIDPDARVIGNPWDGSALIWALHDREAVFTNPGASADVPRAVIRQGLAGGDADPRLCAAVTDLDATFVLTLGTPLWGEAPPEDARYGYGGLYGLVDAGVAEVVATDGENQLLRVTVCD